MNKAFLGEASINTRFIVEAMRRVEVGQIITYEELNAACGRDVKEKRHITGSARNILLRDYSMVFRPVINIGFKRLSDVEVVDVANIERRERMRKQAAKAIKELGCVEYGELPQYSQLSHNTGMALFGSLYQATSKKSVQKLQERVSNAGGELDLTGTLKLIGWMG